LCIFVCCFLLLLLLLLRHPKLRMLLGEALACTEEQPKRSQRKCLFNSSALFLDKEQLKKCLIEETGITNIAGLVLALHLGLVMIVRLVFFHHDYTVARIGQNFCRAYQTLFSLLFSK
jgi:hypothetical protein